MKCNACGSIIKINFGDGKNILCLRCSNDPTILEDESNTHVSGQQNQISETSRGSQSESEEKSGNSPSSAIFTVATLVVYFSYILVEKQFPDLGTVAVLSIVAVAIGFAVTAMVESGKKGSSLEKPENE